MHDTNVLGSVIKSFISVILFGDDEEESTACISLASQAKVKMFYCYKSASWSNLPSLFTMENTVNDTMENHHQCHHGKHHLSHHGKHRQIKDCSLQNNGKRREKWKWNFFDILASLVISSPISSKIMFSSSVSREFWRNYKRPRIFLPIVKCMGHSDKWHEKINPWVEWLLINIIALFV